MVIEIRDSKNRLVLVKERTYELKDGTEEFGQSDKVMRHMKEQFRYTYSSSNACLIEVPE